MRNTTSPPQPSPGGPGFTHTQEKFKNALDFLDQVRLQFAKQPRVYTQFLDIMKDFKAQCIDTPGVISRVSELFKGHPSLILGFNAFLPPGYRIQPSSIETSPKPAASPPPPPMPATPTPMLSPPVASTPPSASAGSASPNPAAAVTRKQPEFDHARNYVKKIKMRFALQPNIYKAFLEILHTYHKEQHTIKDVYDQVATLFQNHKDLLDEFTQFLPDPVANQQGGASSLSSAVRKAKPSIQTTQGGRQVTPKDSRSSKAPSQPQIMDYKQSAADRRNKRSSARRADEMIKKQSNDDDRSAAAAAGNAASYEELNFFFKVKQKLNNQRVYHELLKCLNLFNQDVITKVELVQLVKDLFVRHTDLYELFKKFVGAEEPPPESDKKNGPGSPRQTSHWSEIDFSTCKRYGPSYRALPKNYHLPKCSGRTELCNEVLNETWVSVPTGSEEFSFKNQRKNQYEEALFKCEDERFEFDLIIEQNSSALRYFEPIAKALAEMSPEEAAKYKLEALPALHAKSVERIYGDKGSEVIDALYTNPAVAVPIVAKRLRQKDSEWTKVRRADWNRLWKETNEKNYFKALEYQSLAFRQMEKKTLNTKLMINEIKQRQQDTKINKINGPHLAYKMPDLHLFSDISDLVAFTAEKNFSKSDREKVDNFLKLFVNLFFPVDLVKEHEANELHETANGDATEQQVKDMGIEIKAEKSDEANGTEAVTPAKAKPDQKRVLSLPKKSQVAFGESNFYIFFRLYQILYDRMVKAKTFAKSAQECGPVNTPPTPPSTSPSAVASEHSNKDYYGGFLKSLKDLLAGFIETNKFEDECKGNFGMGSYVLWTLDKLILQLTKQVQMLLTTESCAKLLATYSYEVSKPVLSEPSYLASCIEHLVGTDDQPCRFEFELNGEASRLTMKLLDTSQPLPRFQEVNFDKEKWTKYVDQYVQSDGTVLDVRKHRVFLLRNQKHNKDLGWDRIMQNVDIKNGLECRICLNTYRLFYVEDTEDYFYRRGSLVAARKKPTNVKRYKSSFQ